MSRFTSILALAAVALALTACTPPKAADPKPTDKPEETTPVAEQKIEEMPANLKHDGFKYYGLEATGEQNYEFDLNGSKRMGQQKQTYNGLKDGKPQFTISRAEALAQLGTEIVEVREDGVYIISSREEGLKVPMLALPAKMEVGKTWDISEDMTDPNKNPVQMKAVSKIEGTEKVKTTAGEYDCMVVSMTGSLTSQGKTQKVSGKTWFAAGVGTVKLTVTTHPAEGKPSTYTITLAKPTEGK